ncbi:hypothetical protein [Spirosoma areae]
MNITYAIQKYSILILCWVSTLGIAHPTDFSQIQHLVANKADPHTSPLRQQELHKAGDILFKAYINGDTLIIKKIRASPLLKHPVNNTAEAYVKALKTNQTPSIIYKIDAYQIHLYSDVALVYYLPENETQENKPEGGTQLLDIYQKRKDRWIQTGSHILLKTI